MPDNSIRFADILRVLCAHEVEFIVVGGVAAILEGAPVSTFDLDVMHRRTRENHERLLAALQALGARYRDAAGRTILPDMAKVETFRLHRLLTSAGPLDVLTEIDPGQTFEDVVTETHRYDVSGMTVRVLTLEAVIRSKEHAARDKDRAVLPTLRRTLALRRASGS